MTGTDFCVNKPHMSRSYLNHLVYIKQYHECYGLHLAFTSSGCIMCYTLKIDFEDFVKSAH